MDERHYCTRPFEFFETYDDGSIGFCCPSWYNNYEIGNINDNSVEEVWNGEAAQELRRSILDGSFKYCDEKVCPHLSTKTHCVQTLHQIEVAGEKGWDLVADDIKNDRTILNHSPLQIQFGYDRSCQLACPSCRLEVIMEGGARREFIIGLQDKLRKEAFKDAKTFTITGSGDPFASPVFRELLMTLKEEEAPNLEYIQLLTNGLLLDTYWDKISDFAREKIKHISISIDAASEEMYKKVRKGGDWNRLLENLSFTKKLKDEGQIISFNTSFVIQDENVEEMLDFVDLCAGYDVTLVQFQTYEPDFLDFTENFLPIWYERAVQEKTHPKHGKLINALHHPNIKARYLDYLNWETVHEDWEHGYATKVMVGGLSSVLLHGEDISQLEANLLKYGYKDVYYDGKLHIIENKYLEAFEDTERVKFGELDLVWDGSQNKWLTHGDWENRQILLGLFEAPVFNEEKEYELDKINMDAGNSDLPIVDTSNLFCKQPFENFEVDDNGNVRTCCAYWMNQTIGNIHHSPIEEILNSEEAKKIRASILDGSFSYCNKQTCARLQSKGTYDDQSGLFSKDKVTDSRYRKIIDEDIVEVERIKHVNFLWDDSCNLKCPSCRISSILHTSGKKYDDAVEIQNKIMDFVLNEQPKGETSLNITGSGDAFGSKVFRDFLINFDGEQHPEIQINLQTNGVMFTEKMWRSMHKCHNNIGEVLVSIDAGTKETYDIVRVGGNWDLLMKNIQMLSNLRLEGKIKVTLTLDFVVQKHNYKEMSLAIELANSLEGVDKMKFSLVTDWGTWKRDVFEDHAVWMENNPLHEDFVNSFNNEIFSGDKVDLGNVYHYYEIARGKND